MWTIFTNLARLGGMQLVIAVAAIARNKILAVRLGAEGVGEFSQLVLVVLSAGTVVALGLGVSLNRNVAAAGDTAERQRLLAQANGVNLAISGLFLAVGTVLVLVNPGALSIVGLRSDPTMIAALLILFLYMLLDVAVQQRVSFLTALLDIKGMTAGRSLALLTGTAVSLPLVWFFGLIGAAVQMVVITLTVVVFLDRRCSKIGYCPWALVFDRSVMRKLAALGFASLVVNISHQLSELTVRTMLIKSFAASENGYYQAASSLVNQVATIVLGGVGSYTIAALSQNASKTNVSETSGHVLAVAIPVAVMAFGTIGLLSGPAILFAYSSEFLPAQQIMPVLVAAELLQVVVWVLGAPLLAVNRPWLWALTVLAFEVVRLLSAIWLVPTHGAYGAALSHALANAANLIATAIAFMVLGFSISRRYVALLCLAIPVTTIVALAGSFVVFDLRVYFVGAIMLGLLCMFVVQRTVGFSAVLDRMRLVLRRAEVQ